MKLNIWWQIVIALILTVIAGAIGIGEGIAGFMGLLVLLIAGFLAGIGADALNDAKVDEYPMSALKGIIIVTIGRITFGLTMWLMGLFALA